MTTTKHEMAQLTPLGPDALAWLCACGKGGTTTSAFDGERLEPKARARLSFHRRKALGLIGRAA